MVHAIFGSGREGRARTIGLKRDTDFDHQRAALHQRRQASGQSGRLDAAGRHLRALLPGARATRRCAICATDEHGAPVELAALEEGRPVADYCAKWHAMQKESGRALRPVLGPFRPLVLAAEPRADPAFRAARCGRTAFSRCARPSRSIRTTDRRFLPDRYVDRHLSALRL